MPSNEHDLDDSSQDDTTPRASTRRRRVARAILLTASTLALVGVVAMAVAIASLPTSTLRAAHDWWTTQSYDHQACSPNCYRPSWYGFTSVCSEPDFNGLPLGEVHVRHISCSQLDQLFSSAESDLQKRHSTDFWKEFKRLGFRVQDEGTCCAGVYLIADGPHDRSFELMVGD